MRPEFWTEHASDRDATCIYPNRLRKPLDKYEEQVVSEKITLQEGFEIAIEIEGSEADTVYMYLLSIIRKAIYQSEENLFTRPDCPNREGHGHAH